MPEIFYIISKWWKQMLLIIVISLLIAGAVLYLKPVKYLSVATALPASSYASDKASIFNNNIQQLYPSMGTPDDLDKIIGTAQLDTVYIAVAGEFNLYDHYKVHDQEEPALLKAAYLLKTNTKVIKSDFSELKVKVWDTDKKLAPQLANAIMDRLQSIHQDLQNRSNVSLLKNLQVGKEKILAQLDSTSMAKRQVLSEQLQQYEKLIGEYQLMVDSKAPVLIIVEKARVSNRPDKPKKMLVLFATFVLSSLFAFLLALLLEGRRVVRQ